MSCDEAGCIPPRRLHQTSLQFDDDDAFADSGTPQADQCVEPAAASSEASAAGQAVVRCLDPDDPDASLETMPDEELLRHVHELGTSPDRRGGVIMRRLKGVVLLQQRGLTRPRRIQPEHASAVSPAAQAQNAARMRRRVDRSLRKVASGAGPAAVERLAESLAIWNHSDKTLRYMFATSVNEDAEKVKIALRAASPGGLTKMQITRDVFGGRLPLGVNDVLRDLLAERTILAKKVQPERGRPATLFLWNNW